MSESLNMGGLPEEITISEDLQTDADGKQFLYERDGVKYGGDFLPETPGEIDLERDADFPSPPEEVNIVL